MGRKIEHRLQVFNAGQEPPSGTIDFTLTTEIGDVELGEQRVDVLNGSFESGTARISAVDTAGTITGQIADAGGRMVLMRRIASYSRRYDGGAWSIVQTGRIADVWLDRPARRGGAPASYIFELQDERWIERTTDIFLDNSSTLGSGTASQYAGTLLCPPGIDGDYRNLSMDRAPRLQNPKKFGNYVALYLDTVPELAIETGIGTIFNDAAVLRADVVEFIQSDLKENLVLATSGSGGNFNKTRCRVNGTEREILTFLSGHYVQLLEALLPVTEARIIAALEEVQSGLANYLVTVVYWPTYTSETIAEAVLLAPTAEPTPAHPLHIGGTDGIHPFQLLKDIYDEAGVRYDSTAMTALINDTRYGKSHFRIEGRARVANWVEDNIYRPYVAAPFINTLGQVVPTSIALLQNVDPTTLTQFTNTTAKEPYPTWRHRGDLQVTQIEYTYTSERAYLPSVNNWLDIPDFDGDLILDQKQTFTRQHDRVSTFGVHEKKIPLNGLHTRFWTIPGLDINFPGPIEIKSVQLAREWFERFGDGAIEGEIYGLSATDSVEPGDHVRIQLDEFPYPQTGARGGGTNRVVQITSKQPHDNGARFKWLDAGPASQPLSTPSLSTASPTKHTINVTISGLDAGAGYVLEAAKNASEPASTSQLWEVVATGTTNETTTVRRLASGSVHWFRAHATAPGRIRSAFSTAVSGTTTSLSTPGTVTVSQITGTTAEADWTNTETQYDIQCLLDAAACAGASNFVIATLPPNSTHYDLFDLNLSTTHCFAVRYIDPYGGVSSKSTDEFTTTGVAPICPEPADLVKLVG